MLCLWSPVVLDNDLEEQGVEAADVAILFRASHAAAQGLHSTARMPHV